MDFVPPRTTFAIYITALVTSRCPKSCTDLCEEPLFVGKFLWTKGIQMVISAMPLVLEQLPDVHLLLVGFGSYREELEALIYALDSGRRELFHFLIERSASQLDPGDDPAILKPFRFFDVLTNRQMVERYFDSAQKNRIQEHVHFIGPLLHQELSYLLPCADGFVAASIFPEAFGMVAIEALACGVLPIVSNQTGFKEIVDLTARTIDDFNRTPRVNIDEEMVFNIATNIIDRAQSNVSRRQDIMRACRQLTLDHFSWDRVAARYVENFSHGQALS